jgi:hypothetical protein
MATHVGRQLIGWIGGWGMLPGLIAGQSRARHAGAMSALFTGTAEAGTRAAAGVGVAQIRLHDVVQPRAGQHLLHAR